MCITQTYHLAHKARVKLSSEVARPNHKLRLLVGHANLIDSLMLKLAYAEREPQPFFGQPIHAAKCRESHTQRSERVAGDVDVALMPDASSDFGARDVGMADAFILNNRLPSQ